MRNLVTAATLLVAITTVTSPSLRTLERSHSPAATTDDNSSETYNYVQLGHGGTESRGVLGSATDVISVTAANDITFTGGVRPGAGNNRRSFAHLGLGGYNNGGVAQNWSADGNAPIAADRLGHQADINVTSTNGSLLFTSGSDDRSYVQVGHGGTETDGDHIGNIALNADIDGSNFGGNGGRIVFDASQEPPATAANTPNSVTAVSSLPAGISATSQSIQAMTSASPAGAVIHTR